MHESWWSLSWIALITNDNNKYCCKVCRYTCWVFVFTLSALASTPVLKHVCVHKAWNSNVHPINHVHLSCIILTYKQSNHRQFLV